MSRPSRLITPDEIDEQAQLYRPVWPSLIVEGAALLGICLAVYFAVVLFGIRLQSPARQTVELGLIAVPIGLWLALSWYRERRFPEPRARLGIVLVISLLATNALALPLVEAVFQTERWLPDEGATQRILGYALTGGVAQALTQYLVVYFCAYPRLLRARTDAIAYFIPAALGYAVVENVQFLAQNDPTLQVMAIAVFTQWAVSMTMALLLSFGMAEMRFARPTPFLMMIMFALSAFVYGAAVTFRAGLVNARFSLAGGSASPLFAAFLAAALLVAVGLAIAFFFATAERRSEESARAQRPT